LKTGKLTFYAALSCLIFFTACVDFIYRTVIVDQVTIKFDPRGGTECEEIVARHGETLTLPVSVRSGYSLTGWYSDSLRGDRYGTGGGEYIAEKSVTMYARWSRDLDVGDRDSTISGIPVVRVLAGTGTFIMGSPEDEAGRYFDEVQREVTLTRSYWISKYPVTNFQFGKSAPAAEVNHPVTGVTWDEALNFAASMGGRLPTEAEWEFAARGGNDRHGYLYSGSDVLDDVAWYDANSSGTTHTVGQKQPNELGLHDMSGNVFEWCSDWYGYHTEAPVTDPQGPTSGPGRISRGGAWDRPARDARVADRAYSDPNERNDNVGFRIVFSVE